MKILVILVCGDISVHRTWGLEGRKYDLWISYYGNTPGTYKEDADYYQEKKGFKWPITFEMLTSRKEELEQYDYILLPDDDIAWKSKDILHIAELMNKHDVALGCPSVANHGTCYQELHTKPGNNTRFVNFVEILTPIFSKKALNQVMWTFNESWSGWGIDSIWAWEFNDVKMAVFDEISVQHMRPQFKGEIYPALKAVNRSPQVEAKRIHDLYPFQGCKTLSVLKDS